MSKTSAHPYTWPTIFVYIILDILEYPSNMSINEVHDASISTLLLHCKVYTASEVTLIPRLQIHLDDFHSCQMDSNLSGASRLAEWSKQENPADSLWTKLAKPCKRNRLPWGWQHFIIEKGRELRLSTLIFNSSEYEKICEYLVLRSHWRKNLQHRHWPTIPANQKRVAPKI